jgi:hypothetical protein
LQPIILTALDYLGKADTSALRLANLEVLINAVLYNPSAALLIMERSRPGTARAFFDKWFAAINAPNDLPRVHDKKLSILALCALLEMDPATIPKTLSDGWSGIVAGILRIFKDLPKAIQGPSLCNCIFSLSNDYIIQIARHSKMPLTSQMTKISSTILSSLLSLKTMVGLVPVLFCPPDLKLFSEDVWNEDSAYLELLANEVPYVPRFFVTWIFI